MDKPIKVLAVVCKLMPGGLENRLMDIIRNIDHNRVQIDIYTYQLQPGVYDEEVRSLGGKVYYNPPLTAKNMFWYVGYFCNFLKKHPEYKIVHAHQDAWCTVFCKGAYKAKVPVRIAHSRTAISTKNIGNFVKNIIKLPLKKYANYYFAVSSKAGQWLFGKKLYRLGKVQIWPNAIDPAKFYYDSAVRARMRTLNQWDGKYVVMHVGNFTPPKNHPFILDIFTEVHKKDENSILVLVGDGKRDYIKSLINERNLDTSVILLGSRNDVNELLQAADVFLFPSLFEGLPGALVEAQAAGLPCVFSDTIADEVHITPNISVLSLSQRKELWADEVLKYQTYQRKNTQEYIVAKGFDIHSLASKLCDFYEDAYKKRRIKR